MKIPFENVGSRLSAAFYCGCLFVLALQELVHHWIGLDEYIEYLRKHWVAADTAVPLALIGLIIAGWVYYDARDGVEDE